MSPVASRLLACAVSFALGFSVGTYGIRSVAKPDVWLWIAVAVVLMLTAAAGVVFVDTVRAISFWAVLGVELFVMFTLVPLLWALTVATAPGDLPPQALWPQDISWHAFSDVLSSDRIQSAAATSLLVATCSTLVAVPLAVAAAYGFVRLQVRGTRFVYALAVLSLLIPVVALAGPFADQLMAWDIYGDRLSLVPPALLLTLPLSIWLCVAVFKDVPWTLLDAVRADGATRSQQLRHFVVPHVLPGLLVSAALVFVASCNDFVLGAALGVGDRSQPLPATLMVAAQQADGSSVVVAAGLLWMLPVVGLLLLFSRRITQLLGRSSR